MKRRISGSSDLVAIAVLTLLAILLAIASPPAWLQALGLAPLALALPGYTLAAAFFPPGTLPPSDRLVYTFVFSISAAALGMLLLQLVIDLDRASWIVLMVVVTLAGAAVAWRRRQLLPSQAGAESARRPPPGAAWGLSFLVAITVAGIAIAVASDGVRDQQSQQAFASLWAVPSRDPAGNGPVTVGILNHGGPVAYRLEVSVAGKVVQRFPVRLGDRRQWQTTLPPPVDSSTESLRIALLHRSLPYRSVELNIGEDG
ncbi:MAG: DUF1616 domain-containing protein [Solirubrobacterales bacterium]